jgi:hypothetical protein
MIASTLNVFLSHNLPEVSSSSIIFASISLDCWPVLRLLMDAVLDRRLLPGIVRLPLRVLASKGSSSDVPDRAVNILASLRLLMML